jgi:hypothetical protein
LSKTEQTYERVAHSPTEAARLLGKSRSFVYDEIAKGRLKARMLGTGKEEPGRSRAKCFIGQCNG